MKRITLLFCAVTFLVVACNNESKDEKPVASDSSGTSSAPVPYDTTGMTKAWENFMTPGAMHRWMAKMDGTWEADVTGYMDPANPEKSKATNVVSTFMNGLYQDGKFSSNMMGMPFEGRSTMAYDNSKKLFVSTWIDNMGSGIIYMTGTYDSIGKVLNFKGFQTDPMTGKDAEIREVVKVIDDDSYIMEMYGTGMDGKETKFMEGTFKRKK